MKYLESKVLLLLFELVVVFQLTYYLHTYLNDYFLLSDILAEAQQITCLWYSGWLPVGFNCESWHTYSCCKQCALGWSHHSLVNCTRLKTIESVENTAKKLKPRKLLIQHQINSPVLLSLPPPWLCGDYRCLYFHYRTECSGSCCVIYSHDELLAAI